MDWPEKPVRPPTPSRAVVWQIRLLGAGCWWVFLRGSLCALLRIKLPYIPTPKENEAHDCWGLATPNLIAAAASVGAVIYGLQRDWTPYSWMMAAFALWNAAQLTWVAALGQQKTLERVQYFFARRDWLALFTAPMEKARYHVQCAVLHFMRERPLLAAALAVLAAVGLQVRMNANTWQSETPLEFKDTGGFYVGARFAETERGTFPANFDVTAKELGVKMGLFPLTQEWGPPEAKPFPRDLLRAARLKGAVPLLRWEPRGSTFPRFANHPKLRADRRIFGAVLDGDLNDYLTDFARAVRDFGDPVLICLAPGMDGINQPWSGAGGDSAEDFREAWDYIVALFNDVGASNVGWVWQPSSPSAFTTHLPAKTNVDWIGVPTLNAGQLGGGSWRTFADLYQPFRRKAEPLHLPVLLNEFGTVRAGGDPAAWLRTALAGIRDDFPEIRLLVLPRAQSWYAAQDSAATRAIADGLADSELAPPVSITPKPALWAEQSRRTVRATAIRGSVGNFEMQVDGQPFYVRGIAYNPGHDWRDGFVPLTRRELEADFDRLRSVGANTIRRYGANWYDRNILQVAQEKDLKVLFGFWFDQKLDYLTVAPQDVVRRFRESGGRREVMESGVRAVESCSREGSEGGRWRGDRRSRRSGRRPTRGRGFG